MIDSGFTDQAMKFQVVEAAKLAKEGADLDTVLARIEEVKERQSCISVFLPWKIWLKVVALAVLPDF